MVLFFYCLRLSRYFVITRKPVRFIFILLLILLFFEFQVPTVVKNIFSLYYYRNIGVLIFLSVYLFLSLFLTVKISESFKGYLQKTF